MSRPKLIKQLKSKHPKLNYLGVFCNVNKLKVACDIDYLFSISGPEIQRTLFEEIILDQIKNIPGKKVVVLGNPTSKKTFNSYDDIEIYNHVDRIKQNEFLNRAKFVICRSGYTTVMELVALKKPALMIPTPGQTEQEYLASHYSKLNIFYVAQQKNLNLALELKYVEKNNLLNIGKFPINKIQGLIDVL